MPQQTPDAHERINAAKERIEDVQDMRGDGDGSSIVPQERENATLEQLDEARADVRHSHCYISVL